MMNPNQEYNLNLPQQHIIIMNAPLLRRAVAFAIDIAFILIFLLEPFSVFFKSATSSQSFLETLFTIHPGLATILLASSGLITVLYFSLFEYFAGQTPGMNLVNIKTNIPTFSKAIVRNIYLIPLTPFNLLLIIELWYLFRTKQRFTERFTNTPTLYSMPLEDN